MFSRTESYLLINLIRPSCDGFHFKISSGLLINPLNRTQTTRPLHNYLSWLHKKHKILTNHTGHKDAYFPQHTRNRKVQSSSHDVIFQTWFSPFGSNHLMFSSEHNRTSFKWAKKLLNPFYPHLLLPFVFAFEFNHPFNCFYPEVGSPLDHFVYSSSSIIPFRYISAYSIDNACIGKYATDDSWFLEYKQFP